MTLKEKQQRIKELHNLIDGLSWSNMILMDQTNTESFMKVSGTKEMQIEAKKLQENRQKMLKDNKSKIKSLIKEYNQLIKEVEKEVK